MQSAINQNEYKNRNRNREYRKNGGRENEISREKKKKIKNHNFIDFSKIDCFICRRKERYVRNCIVFESVKKSKKKLIIVVSSASIQIVKNKSVLHHFFILITFYVNTIMQSDRWKGKWEENLFSSQGS